MHKRERRGCPHTTIQTESTSGGSLYLHGHDLPARHVPHLLHHPVRTSSQLGDGLQVIGFHLKVLQGIKTISAKVAAARTCYARSETPLKSSPAWHINSPLCIPLPICVHEARNKIVVLRGCQED